MVQEGKTYDIKERSFEFSKRIVFFIKEVKYDRVFHSLFDQVVRSATSIGANITEGKTGSSKNDFLKFYIMALKSAKETEYWLRLILETLETDNSLYNRTFKRNRRINKNTSSNNCKE